MITAAQLRAARGLLDWTRNELAEAAKVSPETVKNIEHGVFRPQEQTSEAIIRAFAVHGVEFTDTDGVRLRKDSVIKFEGEDGFRRFIDDVYETAKDPSSAVSGNKPICAASIDDRNFIKYLGDYFPVHIRRMNGIKNLKMRILHKEKPLSLLPEEEQSGGYREYRWRSTHDTANVPFYVYGDKLAIMNFDVENPPQIVVIASALVAKAYREQFEAMWEVAKPMDTQSGDRAKLTARK